MKATNILAIVNRAKSTAGRVRARRAAQVSATSQGKDTGKFSTYKVEEAAISEAEKTSLALINAIANLDKLLIKEGVEGGILGFVQSVADTETAE